VTAKYTWAGPTNNGKK